MDNGQVTPGGIMLLAVAFVASKTLLRAVVFGVFTALAVGDDAAASEVLLLYDEIDDGVSGRDVSAAPCGCWPAARASAPASASRFRERWAAAEP